MKILKKEIIGEDKNGDCIIAKIVDSNLEHEKEDFEVYELKVEETLSKEQKKELSLLIKKYLKSYSKYKDKMSIEEWLMLIFRKDFPELDEKEIIKLKDEVINGTNESYKIYKEVKRAGEIGINPNEYFATKIENSPEFRELDNKKEILLELDNQLTEDAIDKIYTLSQINIENTEEVSRTNQDIATSIGKTLGQSSVNNYIGRIENVLDSSNLNMQNTILNKDGSINQNPNLDGFIAESHHSNTFNLDAVIKELKVKAEDLKPDVYGKNSVDIVIKKVSNGTEKTVRKYQVKFGKDFKATESYFKNKAGEYKYYFQRKLVGEDQVNDIANSVDRIEYVGVESIPISKAEVKEMQNKVQSGDKNALDLTFEKDVNINKVLKRIGNKAVRNGIYSGSIAVGLDLGKKILSGEEVKGDEVIETAIKSGMTSGVTTAVHGAMTTASKKGLLKGIFANNNFISAIAFSSVETISTIFKIGSGEIGIKEGVDNIGEIFTSGLVIVKGMAIAGKSGGIISTLAGLMGAGALATTLSSVVIGGVIATVGTAVAKPLYHGAKAVVGGVVTGAKTVVSAGVSAVKSVASCAWSGVKTVAGGICNGVKTVASGISNFVSGLFGGWW